MTTKTIGLTQNTSNAASHISYVPGDNILSGNTQPVGSVAIGQSFDGVLYPNVQAALDDVVSLFELPVDHVITNTSGISPAGLHQIDTLTFSGIVRLAGKVTGEKVQLNTFGFWTEVLIGDSADEVVAKVKVSLDVAKSSGLVFNEVRVGSQLNILEVTYNDYQKHSLPEYTNLGIKIAQTVQSPSKPGYGVWLRLGTETKTLVGGTGNVTLHYFRRDS